VLNGPRDLPEPARSIAAAVTGAVDAATARDAEAFEEATAKLAALDPEQVGLVQGNVVRALLEDLHPDGLAGEDVHDALTACVRSAVGWFPRVQPHALVVVLTGALGVHQPTEAELDPDDERPPAVTAADLARHAPLLIADLLAGGRRLAPYLAAAFADIQRSELQELP
jgi:hypothetical protein